MKHCKIEICMNADSYRDEASLYEEGILIATRELDGRPDWHYNHNGDGETWVKLRPEVTAEKMHITEFIEWIRGPR